MPTITCAMEGIIRARQPWVSSTKSLSFFYFFKNLNLKKLDLGLNSPFLKCPWRPLGMKPLVVHVALVLFDLKAFFFQCGTVISFYNGVRVPCIEDSNDLADDNYR